MRNCKNVGYYLIGKNSLNELKNLLDARRTNSKIVVFAIDHYFKGKDLEKKLFVDKNKDIVIYVDTTHEPKTEYIDGYVQLIKSKCKSKLPDAIVGVGGGSTLDSAKAISVMLTNPGKTENYQGWDLVKKPAIYKIGITTLSGTGSESSRTAVLTSKIKKLGINSDQSVFDQIILDPVFQDTVPKEQFIYSAMDCFVHNVESLSGTANDAFTIAYAEKSLELLREIFSGKMDYEKLMVASYYGGLAVANSNVGICHPLSYGLSLVLGYHHGIAISLTFNQLEEYYPLVKDFKKILKKYNVELPKGIMKDVSKEKIEAMIDATLLNEKPLSNAFGPDWRQKFTREKIRSLLLKM